MKQVAVITGGGAGIGKAVAIALSNAGWHVVVAGRTKARLEETVAEIQTGALAVECDVSVAADVERLFESAVEAFGQVDLLFNNAGVAASAVPVDELSLDEWHKVVAINLSGAFMCARAAFGQMRKQSSGGRIINNGSVSATTPRLYSSPYTCTKHAITGLTKSLSLDGRRFGISCSQIDLGNISSSMGDAMAQGVLQANGSMLGEPTISVKPVCDAILYMVGLPPEANVLNMTVMANGMPFVGRG
ncbi:MAG: SDR family oxidoreductase [Granulosicoccus sp.]